MGQAAPAQKQFGDRRWTFYALSAFFALFVAFLYGPMSAIYILSFQGPTGGLTFPMQGYSLHWFVALFQQQRTGDFAGAFTGGPSGNPVTLMMPDTACTVRSIARLSLSGPLRPKPLPEA